MLLAGLVIIRLSAVFAALPPCRAKELPIFSSIHRALAVAQICRRSTRHRMTFLFGTNCDQSQAGLVSRYLHGSKLKQHSACREQETWVPPCLGTLRLGPVLQGSHFAMA